MPRVYTVTHKKSFFSRLSLTNQLIILNLVLFILSSFIIYRYGEKFFLDNFALTPILVLSGQKLWTFFSSIFLHGGFFHIFANMFSLFFVGNFLEKLIGKKRFFWIYLFAGLMGGVFFVLAGSIFGDPKVPAVGASGAIFGILGALALLVPYSKIYLIAGPFVLLVVEVIVEGGNFLPAALMSPFTLIINILFFVMIFSLFSFNSSIRKISLPIELPMWLLPLIAIVPLVIIGFYINLPIGNSAHIGGLVVGLAYGFYLRKKFPKKTAYLSKHFR